MASTQSEAAAWFDQFPLDGIRGNEQWCARHWAPCPIFGANGIGASLEVMQAFIGSMTGPRSPEELNAEMQRAGRLCCTLGDERMYEIWGHWPPASTVPNLNCPDCGQPVQVDPGGARDTRHDHCGPLPHTGPVGGPYCEQCG